jgi:hypothetical protein
MLAALLSSSLLFLPAVNAAYCSGVPDAGTRVNDLPILDDTVSFVKNGVNASL